MQGIGRGGGTGCEYAASSGHRKSCAHIPTAAIATGQDGLTFEEQERSCRHTNSGGQWPLGWGPLNITDLAGQRGDRALAGCATRISYSCHSARLTQLFFISLKCFLEQFDHTRRLLQRVCDCLCHIVTVERFDGHFCLFGSGPKLVIFHCHFIGGPQRI